MYPLEHKSRGLGMEVGGTGSILQLNYLDCEMLHNDISFILAFHSLQSWILYFRSCHFFHRKPIRKATGVLAQIFQTQEHFEVDLVEKEEVGKITHRINCKGKNSQFL